MASKSFNIYFINQLLLKLSNKYPNRHFANKIAVLNHMAKALANELLTTCSFGPAVRTSFFVKLLKNITLTECDKSKILQMYKMYMDTRFKNYKLHHLSNLKLFHRETNQ
ncbi:hypothetical protein [Orientia tsutsugamushi]|uniref:hypothetical protein n=1 Tax=Orientia tsutsugamushi TaxID=784 RepID=UPI002FC5F234